MSTLPTIIVVHPRELRAKCTVEPLRGDARFAFWKFPKMGSEPLANYVRLGYGGPIISPDDASRGLLVLDGTWKLAERMVPSFVEVEVRSLPVLKTAYPRSSKVFFDPSDGLATIEAIYAAYKLMERDTTGLLDQYRWKDEFLRANDF
jgi:pre-rRNA-processing protein TSR3